MSVTSKASRLVKQGNVSIDAVTFTMISGTVVTEGTDGIHEHDVHAWRDGHYTCTCQNFMYSKSEHLGLWDEGVRVKPECKHALALKFTPEYRQWIRMVVIPTDDGYSLTSIEFPEAIHVKSLDEKIGKDRLIPKIKQIPPRLFRAKIPIDKIFGD